MLPWNPHKFVAKNVFMGIKKVNTLIENMEFVALVYEILLVDPSANYTYIIKIEK